ncbi:MAG: hypothetical protein E2O59_06885 [Gammaproteobacteria bacterium]|nr:MAG: hypothetical protein E2O59_06885 [Gammaproteobacteria bacterium]
MLVSRNSLFTRAAITAAILIYAGIVSSADEETEPDDSTTTNSIEEIVVYADKPGNKIDMDARYEELYRTRAAAELDRLEVLNEEFVWRKSMAAAEDSSRIKWGYDVEAEMSMRSDTSLIDLPTDTVKPATLFRVQF